MKVKVLSCLLGVLLILCSCNQTGTDTGEKDTSFPVAPDSIIVGAEGVTKELVPGEDTFEEVLSGIKKRADRTKNYGESGCIAYDPNTGHVSDELRKSEVFVEFIYNDTVTQSFLMRQTGGKSATEEYQVSRIFFSLTGEYHDDFFVSDKPEYGITRDLTIRADNTSLITYVRELVSTENATK